MYTVYYVYNTYYTRYCIQCIQYKYFLSSYIFTALIPELVQVCFPRTSHKLRFVCVCVFVSLSLYTIQNPNIFIFIETSVIYCECDGQRKPLFKEVRQRQTNKPQKKSSHHHREKRVNNQQRQWKGQKSKNIHDINFWIHSYLRVTDLPLRIFMVNTIITSHLYDRQSKVWPVPEQLLVS